MLRGSARLRWFQRADITGSGGEPEPPGRTRGLENSVNQAFRRCPPRPAPPHLAPHVHPAAINRSQYHPARPLNPPSARLRTRASAPRSPPAGAGAG